MRQFVVTFVPMIPREDRQAASSEFSTRLATGTLIVDGVPVEDRILPADGMLLAVTDIQPEPICRAFSLFVAMATPDNAHNRNRSVSDGTSEFTARRGGAAVYSALTPSTSISPQRRRTMRCRHVVKSIGSL